MDIKRSRQIALLVMTGDMATRERCQQNGGVIVETVNDTTRKATIQRQRVFEECPLDAYFRQGKLTAAQHEAGLKFRSAYLHATLGVRVSDGGAGCHGDVEMATLSPIYSQQVLSAAYGVLSPPQRLVVIDICGHDNWVSHSSRTKTLIRGLEKLAKYWGI